MRQALLLKNDGNTWRMISREAVGNDRQVVVTQGRLAGVSPSVCVEARGDAAEFTLSGGLGYVPITIEGLTCPDGHTLWVDGLPVDQGVHGNDYWQTDHDPVARRRSRTYTLPLAEGQARQIRLSASNPSVTVRSLRHKKTVSAPGDKAFPVRQAPLFARCRTVCYRPALSQVGGAESSAKTAEEGRSE